MLQLSVTWKVLKGKGLTLKYIPARGNYYIYGTSDDTEYSCVISDSSQDGIEFNHDYMADAVSLV